MKQRTIYEAKDGKQFSIEYKCEEYEKLIDKIEELKRNIFPKQFDNTDFSNGGGYIQLTSDQKKTFINGYLDLIRDNCSEDVYKLAVQNPVGFVGRRLSDGGSPIYGLYCLLSQIDHDNRLWGHSYFALNPSKGKQVKLHG